MSFVLYLISDRHVAGGPDALVRACASVAAALPPGSLGIQVREKDLSTRQLLELTSRILDSVAGTGTKVLVNDRIDCAIAAGADGVHLPSSGMPPGLARRFYSGIIGISTHSIAELLRLDPRDVSFATFGPVGDTPSKRAFGPPQGLARLREAVTASRIPVFALGGITLENALEVKRQGVAGIAVIRAVLQSPDPVISAMRLFEAFTSPAQET